MSRAPQGARGLKFLLSVGVSAMLCRAPQGARGLKFILIDEIGVLHSSRPARGAWVEIPSVGRSFFA